MVALQNIEYCIRKATFTLQAKVVQIHFFCPPISFFCDSLNGTNPIFLCGPWSDMYPMVCNVTSVWTVMSYFIWLSHHWNATDVAILRWRRREPARSMFTPVSTACCMWLPSSSAHVGHFGAIDCWHWSLKAATFKSYCKHPQNKQTKWTK